jgi:hypothetical protein
MLSDAGAAPPTTIRVQGHVSDRSGGTPVPANGTFQMTFRLFDNAIAGTLVAASGPAPVQVTSGLYNADVVFPPSAFNSGSLYLEVQIGAEILTPRIPVVSVPYAYVAAQATGVAPGGVGTASIATGAVTLDKLAACSDHETIVRLNGAWVCRPLPLFCKSGTDALPCYNGPPGTRGVGLCRDGGYQCNADGTDYSTVCTNQVLPAPEICGNGVDEDCDGVIDNPIGPHTTGYGPYYSCHPLGVPGDPSTYSLDMALVAAEKVGGGTVTTTTGSCTGPQIVALVRQSSCLTWSYQGTTAGHTHGGGACDCPTASDPIWN